MQKLTKVFKGVIKSINEENHTATVTVSTASVDRDQEVVLPSAFKNRIATYLAHPIMLASHNPYQLENQIGEAKDIQITDTGLDVTFEWYAGKGNPQADWGWFLVTRKIAAFSVGMMIYGYQEGTRNPPDGSYLNGIRGTFTDIEVLEISQVLIPSNREAMQSRLGKAQNEEAELLEMAVKSIKDTEWPVEKIIEPLTKEAVAEMIKEAIKDINKEAIEKINKPLTFLTDSLLGEGPKAILTPTKDEVRDIVSEILKKAKLI